MIFRTCKIRHFFVRAGTFVHLNFGAWICRPGIGSVITRYRADLFRGWGSVSYDVDYHAVFYYQFHIVSVSFHFHFVDEFVGGFYHIYVVIVYLEE